MAFHTAIVTALQANPDGIEVNEIGSKIGCRAEEAQEGLNRLLAEHKVVLVQVGSALRVKLTKEESADLSNEERVLQSLVDEAGSKGIWIRSLRDNSGLSQLQIRKALKTLEQKKLIKAVKAVGTTKKCYMPFDAVEDVSLTGGTFYSDRQLDLELVQTLLTVSVNMLASKRKMAAEIHPGDALSQRIASYASTTEVTNFIRDKKFLNVPITDSDIDRILEVAVLDGLVDRRGDGSVRLLEAGGVKTSATVSIPCAICPVATDCGIDKEINPCHCKYFSDWLAGR